MILVKIRFNFTKLHKSHRQYKRSDRCTHRVQHSPNNSAPHTASCASLPASPSPQATGVLIPITTDQFCLLLKNIHMKPHFFLKHYFIIKAQANQTNYNNVLTKSYYKSGRTRNHYIIYVSSQTVDGFLCDCFQC